MTQETTGSQLIDLMDEFQASEGVSFDPEHITLEGTYADQISAYRARKVWLETFEANFLLEPGHDFSLRVISQVNEGRFSLRCEFLTACARYAFWRLTNNQAPEAQYIIETAHIPNAELRQDDLLEAPDMRSTHEPAILRGVARATREIEEANESVAEILKRILHTIIRR